MAVSKSSSSSKPKATSRAQPAKSTTSAKSKPAEKTASSTGSKASQESAKTVEQERAKVDAQTQADTRQRVAAEEQRRVEDTQRVNEAKSTSTPTSTTSAPSTTAPRRGLSPDAAPPAAATDLQSRAAQGDKAALDELRGNVDRAWDGGDAAVRELAGAKDQLAPEDYQRFADKGLGGFSGEEAQKALVDGMKEKRPGAEEAVKEVLLDEKSSPYSRENAAKVFEQGGGQLTEADVKQLEKLTQTGDERGDAAAFKALADAGTRADAPNPAALEAAERVQDNLGKAPGYYMGKESQAFTEKAWANPETRPAVADQVLQGTFDDARAQEAAGLVKERAATGDQRALDSLVEATGGRNGEHAADNLAKLAEEGHAQKVTDGLLEQARKQPAGETLRALGASGAHLEGNDPRLDQVRRELRSGVSQTDKNGWPTDVSHGAVEGMHAISDKLDGQDLKAVADNLSDRGVELIQKAGPQLSANEARPAIDSLLDGAQERWEKWDPAQVKALEGFASQMNAGDVQKLGDIGAAGKHSDAVNDTLSEVLTQNKSPEAQRKAADAMLDSPVGSINDPARQRLVDYAAASNDPQLKQDVLGRVPEGPLSDAKLAEAGERFNSTLESKIRNAKDGSLMKQLGDLYKLKAANELDKSRGNINTEAIDDEISRLAGGPLKSDLESIQKDAVRSVVGGDPAKAQQDYLLSDAFKQRQQLEDPATRVESYQKELTKLAMMDSERAQTTANELARSEVVNHAGEIYKSQDPASTQKAIESSFDAITEIPGFSSTAKEVLNGLGEAEKAAVAKEMDKILREGTEGTDNWRAAQEKIEAIVHDARRLENAAPNSPLAKANKIIDALAKDGRLGTAVAAFGATSLAMGGAPATAKEWAETAAKSLSVMSSASDVGRLLNVGNLREYGDGLKDFGKLTTAGKWLKGAEFLGPAADAITAALDFRESYLAGKRGDRVGATTSAVSGVGGLLSLGGGVALALGASGPVGWGLLAGGAVLSLGATGYNHLFGESDIESFARRGYVDESGQRHDFWIEPEPIANARSGDGPYGVHYGEYLGF